MLRFLCLVFVSTSCLAFADEIPNASFAPFQQHTLISRHPFSIPFILNQEAREIILDIYSPDNNVIRHITQRSSFKKGFNSITWDGKDDHGISVPNEAYTPVLHITFSDSHSETIDPRDKSKTDFFTPAHIKVINSQKIHYSLEKPARVQLRIGIENGPMVRELENWPAKDQGDYVIDWNGFDDNGVISLKEHPNLAISVSALSLPDQTIIATGNNAMNYRQYYKKYYPQETAMIFSRKDQPPQSAAIVPPLLSKKIPLHLSLDEKEIISPANILIIKKPSVIHLTMDTEDRWMVTNGKFEVGFFVDYVFSSEAEQYFLPIAWTLYPEQYSSGEHILSVNINGPYGTVATQHLKFSVP